jgi:hypothetical protein
VAAGRALLTVGSLQLRPEGGSGAVLHQRLAGLPWQGDTPDKIDWDKVARFTRRAYQMGMEIANTSERPKWDPASYQKYVGVGNH